MILHKWKQEQTVSIYTYIKYILYSKNVIGKKITLYYLYLI